MQPQDLLFVNGNLWQILDCLSSKQGWTLQLRHTQGRSDCYVSFLKVWGCKSSSLQDSFREDRSWINDSKANHRWGEALPVNTWFLCWLRYPFRILRNLHRQNSKQITPAPQKLIRWSPLCQLLQATCSPLVKHDNDADQDEYPVQRLLCLQPIYSCALCSVRFDCFRQAF